MSNVNGFMVVRLPNLNYDKEGRGVFLVAAPCIGDLCYGGIDRMPWFEIDELFYAGTLPNNIAQALKMLKETNRDFSSIRLTKDLELASNLLHFSNNLYPANELIAVRSEKLGKLKGIANLEGASVNWLGYDPVVIGEWSLLEEGLFAIPSAFPGWESQLNEFGLFSSPDQARGYAQAYEIASEKGEVEELGEERIAEGYGFDPVEVGRVVLLDSPHTVRNVTPQTPVSGKQPEIL